MVDQETDQKYMDAAIVMKLFFSADIDDLPLEGINPLNEPPGPPPAPRLGQKNPGKQFWEKIPGTKIRQEIN